jgi:short subunit fatty acids transporter
MSEVREDQTTGRGSSGAISSALAEIRGDVRARWAALVAATVLGLAAAWIHWYGLLLGGALVGLASKDLKRALAAGIGFGLLAWVAFVGLMATNGGTASVVQYAETGRLLYLSVGIPVGLSALGSLVRGVV